MTDRRQQNVLIGAAQPDVSVVVIARNERERAPECVRAILEQDAVVTTELIFVDDGSTDGTSEAVAAAAGGDPRLRLLQLPKSLGRGGARSAGVDAARAPLIGFVDADVTLPSDWLRRCLATLPGHAAVSGIPVPDGDIAVVARVSGARTRPTGGSALITGSNVLFDGAVLRATGFDAGDRLGEDFRLARRLTAAGHRLVRVPGLKVRHEERRSYRSAIRWRYDNGVDAASHLREFGRVRLADIVWLGNIAAWAAGAAGALAIAPALVTLGPVATAAAAGLQVAARFHPTPFVPFLRAWAADVPLMAAYLTGRTVAAPQFVLGRRHSAVGGDPR